MLKHLIARLTARGKRIYRYVTVGVWSDPGDSLRVRIIKAVNLTVNSFLDRNLQVRSQGLTYSTVLALVPAVALLVAIGRGFGMQDNLQQELYTLFPAQARAIAAMLGFVDSYLKQASQGIFVGVGIVVLLWTVISLLSSIEEAFNEICDVKVGRTIYQKVTDYIAICLIVPVLLICSSGLSIFVSTTIQNVVHLPFITPVLVLSMEFLTPVVLSALAFSFSFFLIPNTKITFRYALVSGAICAVVFSVLQLLMVNGQIYVSKYNAIYGSFAFLPLLLVWLQLSWLLLLSGMMLTYSLQNVFAFNYMGAHEKVSQKSEHLVAIVVMAVVVQRFVARQSAPTAAMLSSEYFLPVRVVRNSIEKMRSAGFVNLVDLGHSDTGVAPSSEVSAFSVAAFIKGYESVGDKVYQSTFESIYRVTLQQIGTPLDNEYASLSEVYFKDIDLPTPKQIKQILSER